MEQTVTAQKILVIDDENTYREIIAMTLKIAGYDVIESSNGQDGLAAAKKHFPDLILCDINMPNMDGHAVLTSLKEEHQFAGIPFIFLTGNSSSADVRKGMQLGADDYLTKPFTAEELVNAVATRLTKKKKMQRFYESQFDDIKSNIVHSLPHEFRTPLNGILGFSQILMVEQGLPQEEIEEIGSMINRSGHRLHRLLENVVLFGQLQLWMRDEQKIAELRSETGCTLKEVIPQVTEKLIDRHGRIGALTITVVDAVIRISAHQFTKIIEEIVDNAMKFSLSGTPITLTTEMNEGFINITVKDEGRGMSEEQIKKISGFQQFERGYYEQQGAGLGLTIVKLLTEIHGGSLTLRSVEKKGTTVIISLPAVLPSP